MLIEKALKEISERRKKIKGWAAEEEIATKLKEKFSHDGIEIRLSIGWEYGYINGILVHVEKARNFESDIKPIIRFLGKHGYMHDGKPEFMGWCQRVHWKFGNIALLVFFNSTEPNACHFEKVGKEETDVYEIDCPGMEKKEVSHEK